MNPVSRTSAIAMLLLGIASGACAHAQSSGGPYTIERVAIAGGGGAIAGGAYRITSTLGQPATATLSGAAYVVFDGFWAPVGGTLGDVIFADGFDSH